MTNQLTQEELEKFQNLNKTADQVIFNLGLASYEQYKLYTELAKLDALNGQYSKELLEKYGEGELNLKDGTFTTKES